MNKRNFLILIFLLLLPLFNCSDNKAEFTIWIGGAPEELDYWESLIQEFERESGEKLILVRQPTYTDQRKQGLIISLEARQPNPDLFLMDVIWIKQFIRSGWLEPLNKYMQEGDFSTQPFFQKVVNTVDRSNDQFFALPVFLDVGLLYYRKDLIAQYNSGEPPETWESLIEYARPIQQEKRTENTGFNGFVWQGAQYEGLVCTFLEFLASNGGGIMKDGAIRLETEANEEALGLMQDLIHKYHISPPNTYTEMKEEEVRQAFQRGDAAFERNWTYAWKQHQAPQSPVKGKTGVALIPHFQNHASASTVGGWHIGISHYSDAKDKAWEFMRFITSYQAQKKLMLNIGWTPGRQDVYQDPEIIEKLPHIPVLEEALRTGVTRPNVAYYSQVTDVIQRFVNKCLAGKISPEGALKQMQSEIDQITEIYESD